MARRSTAWPRAWLETWRGATFAPRNFLGLAGFNLFRDELLAGLSFLFRADHRWFKRHRVYDTLPHRHRLARLGSALLGPVFAIPPIKRRFLDSLKSGMVKPATRVVEEA